MLYKTLLGKAPDFDQRSYYALRIALIGLFELMHEITFPTLEKPITIFQHSLVWQQIVKNKPEARKTLRRITDLTFFDVAYYFGLELQNELSRGIPLQLLQCYFSLIQAFIAAYKRGL
jgi:hypothetical protein